MLITSCNMSVSSLVVYVQNHQKQVQRKKKLASRVPCVAGEYDVQTLSTPCAGRPNIVCLYRIICV